MYGISCGICSLQQLSSGFWPVKTAFCSYSEVCMCFLVPDGYCALAGAYIAPNQHVSMDGWTLYLYTALHVVFHSTAIANFEF